ncbi:MAG: cytochrome C biogenesis protein [bacterium]|nr:cytochrome C biogenesis protein [bacterium]
MLIEVKKVKVVVMIPVSHTKEVFASLNDAFKTVGVIGNYTNCTTILRGKSTFKPSANANPFLGQKEELTITDEDRLEVICNIEEVKPLIRKIKEVHPYEEVGIDIYPLIDIDDIEG